MQEDRIARALARIETAAGRIEVARSARGAAADPELERKYETLRGEANAVLGDLDRLIGALDR